MNKPIVCILNLSGNTERDLSFQNSFLDFLKPYFQVLVSETQIAIEVFTKKTFQKILTENSFDYLIVIESQNNLSFYDREFRRFKIDLINDHLNYKKTKLSIKNEPLARALGSGEKGLKLVDFSAGLAVDSLFLAQLGFHVTAVERNPLIYLALKSAYENYKASALTQLHLNFIFSSAQEFYKNEIYNKFAQHKTLDFDVAYFDPMFPEKKKSALPKQEMAFFKSLVGQDLDAEEFVKQVVSEKLFKRFVVKRPLKADAFMQPQGCIEGKLIRFDIYSN